MVLNFLKRVIKKICNFISPSFINNVTILTIYDDKTYTSNDIYPDALSIHIIADYTLGFFTSRNGTCGCVELINKEKNKSIRITSNAFNKYEKNLYFTIDNISELTNNTGNWIVKFYIQNVFEVHAEYLGNSRFNVISHQMMIDDLIVKQKQLIVIKDEIPYISNTVTTDCSSIMPIIKAKTLKYTSERYKNFIYKIDICCESSNCKIIDSTNFVPQFNNNEFTLDQIDYLISNISLGQWSFRFSISNYEFCCIIFDVVTKENILNSLKFKQINLFNNVNNTMYPIKNKLANLSIGTIVPAIEITSEYEAPWMSFETSIHIAIKDQQIGHVVETSNIRYGSNLVLPGEVSFPQNMNVAGCVVVFSIAINNVFCKSVEFNVAANLNLTDAQGRLLIKNKDLKNINWENEAEIILNQARMQK